MGLFPNDTQDSAKPTWPEDLRCSFCSKSRADVRKLIAGPSVFICDECIELCSDIIEEENSQAENLSAETLANSPIYLSCGFCSMPVEVGGFVTIPDRGQLCAACLDAIRAATEDDDEEEVP